MNEASVRNRKILAALKGDLGAEIAAHKDIPVNHGLEFRYTTVFTQLFLHYEDNTKIINIIKHGSCYHLDTIEKETRKSDLDAMILRGNHK